MTCRRIRLASAAALLMLWSRPSDAKDLPPDADGLRPLSDEFDEPKTLSHWRRVFRDEGWQADQLEALDIGKTRKGWLTMMPYSSSWYQDYRGELTYKTVEGDFVVTTSLRVSGRDGKAAPGSQFSLGGLMLRAPRAVTPKTWRPGGENYVFLALGAADAPRKFQFEVKTTVDSDSRLAISDADAGAAQLRAARIGPALILLRKSPGGPWVVHKRYDRADFPKHLQVGLTVYTDWSTVETLSPQQHNSRTLKTGNPDLLAQFDYVRFSRPRVPAELLARSLSDPDAVSDAELLGFLGEVLDRQP